MDGATLLVVQKSKTLKILGAVGGLFLVSFLPFVTLKIKSGCKKRCLYFKIS